MLHKREAEDFIAFTAELELIGSADDDTACHDTHVPDRQRRNACVPQASLTRASPHSNINTK